MNLLVGDVFVDVYLVIVDRYNFLFVFINLVVMIFIKFILFFVFFEWNF